MIHPGNLSLVGATLAVVVAFAGCGGKSSDTSVVGSTGGTSSLLTSTTTGTTTSTGTGGEANVGGTAGIGGSGSTAVSPWSALYPVSGPSSVDLLLMIDNSASMADKQKTLADAVPQLLTQLVQPICVDSTGAATSSRVALGTGACPVGTSPEFNPVNNIHVGIITSSLGDHGGGGLCSPGVSTSFVDPNGNVIPEPDDVNDKGHLVGTLARYVSTTIATTNVTVDAMGFLAWGNSTRPIMGNGDLTAGTGLFKDMVLAIGERGCGLEAQLESWFRLLIDPVPPVLPIIKDSSQQALRLGSDDALLAQRAAFLRPDSLLAIVMLTDENDCSLRDTDVGWVATNTKSSMTTGSTACAANPNDRCCYSCTATAPAGCSNGCVNTTSAAVDDSPFQANIRCWHQKRRFGYDFMYPTSRYVVGLTHATLCPDQTFGDMDCACTYAKTIGADCSPGSRQMPNPLYSNVIGTRNDGTALSNASAGATPRMDNSAIFLAGIVGVPWQDIGYKDSSGNLVYIPVTDPSWTGQPYAGGPSPVVPVPAVGGIWANIFGDDNSNIVPADPHMIESLEPRPGIAAYDTIEHEWNTAYQDLQYACIYPLPQSRKCACDVASSNYATCKYYNPNDCCDLSFSVNGRGDANSGGEFNKPLCNGNTQVNAKAYPGLREIAVLHDYALTAPVQGNSIVASICPADVVSADMASAGYGYNPTVTALVTRLKEKFKGAACLPRQLSAKSDGTVPCSVVEVVGASAIPNGTSCEQFCVSNSRMPVEDASSMRSEVLESMKSSNLCDTSYTSTCSSMCLCELLQEQRNVNGIDNLAVCQNEDDGTVSLLPPGFCYVEPDLLDANGVHLTGANQALVASCPSTARRIVRFAGNNPTGITGSSVPLAGAMVFTSCLGSS